MEKGQGALEYLLLIGGAVLVAVVVITLLLGITDSAGDSVDTTAKSGFDFLKEKRDGVIDPGATVLLQDDFGDGTIDTALWSVTSTYPGEISVTETGGQLRITGTPIGTHAWEGKGTYTKATFPIPFQVDFDLTILTTGRWGKIELGGMCCNNNIFLKKDENQYGIWYWVPAGWTKLANSGYTQGSSMHYQIKYYSDRIEVYEGGSLIATRNVTNPASLVNQFRGTSDEFGRAFDLRYDNIRITEIS